MRSLPFPYGFAFRHRLQAYLGGAINHGNWGGPACELRVFKVGDGFCKFSIQASEAGERQLADGSFRLESAVCGTQACCTQTEAERRFIGFDDSMPELPQKLWLDGHVGARRYALRANDMVAMCQAAGQGWGIALLPRFLAAKDHRLQWMDAAMPPPSLTVYLVMHADVRRAPRVRSTADYLIEMFGRHAGEF